MKNKRFLIKAAAAGTAVLAGLYLRSEYEKDNFVVESTALFSSKVRRHHRLVFLTDIHDKEFGQGNHRLIDAVGEIKPQAILIGGDTMTAKSGRADLKFTEALIAALTRTAPVFYANGNHEQRIEREKENYPGVYEAFCELLKKYGVVYLSDSSACIDDEVRVSGLNLDEIYYKNFSTPILPVDEITSQLGKADESRYQILLAHSPLFFDSYAEWGADLTLAGHFHGGTIRIPKLGGVMTPQFQFFSPYCAGTFRKEDKVMIVGRGLGTHSVNIRLGDKPQVYVLEISPA